MASSVDPNDMKRASLSRTTDDVCHGFAPDVGASGAALEKLHCATCARELRAPGDACVGAADDAALGDSSVALVSAAAGAACHCSAARGDGSCSCCVEANDGRLDSDSLGGPVRVYEVARACRAPMSLGGVTGTGFWDMGSADHIPLELSLIHI